VDKASRVSPFDESGWTHPAFPVTARSHPPNNIGNLKARFTTHVATAAAKLPGIVRFAQTGPLPESAGSVVETVARLDVAVAKWNAFTH
jgi:hypothetical protein